MFVSVTSAWLTLLTGCSSSPPPAPPPVEPEVVAVPEAPPGLPLPLSLSRHTAAAKLNLAPSTRPADKKPSPRILITGPWEPSTTGSTVYKAAWSVPKTLLSTNLRTGGSFGAVALLDVAASHAGKPLEFAPKARTPGSWGYDADHLWVQLPDKTKPRAASVKFPAVEAAEKQLHADSAGLEAPEFAARTLVFDDESQHGLLLPAPSEATWRVQLDQDAAFQTQLRIAPAAFPWKASSDGATVVLEVVKDDGAEAIGSWPVTPDAPVDVQQAIPSQGGPAELRLRIEPGEDATLDLVFLADPTIVSAADKPTKTVVIWLDGVRRDHIGTYGYTVRETTPKIDAWAAGAVVFDDARTVAPWGLPAAKAAFSGAQPELWDDVDNVAEQLGKAGVRTEFLTNDPYLHPVFGMDRGWSSFHRTMRMSAAQALSGATEALNDRPGQDALVVVHLTDTQQPFREPAPYRTMFVTKEPADTSVLRKLRKLDRKRKDLDDIKSYAAARYDQNLRYIDAAIGDWLPTLDEDTYVVLVANHGLELWDNGGFGAGHAFPEALLRVPFILSGPGLDPANVTAPVSVLDLAPTLLDLFGAPADTPHGQSLIQIAKGGASDAFTARPRAFGRAFYGIEGWGVVHNGRKWLSRGTQRNAYDLAQDPTETKNIARGTAKDEPGWLGQALGTPLRDVWQLHLMAKPGTEDLQLKIHHQGDLSEAWQTYKPRGSNYLGELTVKNNTLVIRPDRRGNMPQSIALWPGEGKAPGEGLKITLSGGGKTLEGEIDAKGAAKRTMLRLGDAKLGVAVERTWSAKAP